MAAKEMDGVRRTTSARFCCCFFLFFVSSFLRFSARRFVTSLLRIDSLLFSVQMNKRKGWKKKFRFASSLRQQQNIRLFLFCFFLIQPIFCSFLIQLFTDFKRRVFVFFSVFLSIRFYLCRRVHIGGCEIRLVFVFCFFLRWDWDGRSVPTGTRPVQTVDNRPNPLI